MHQSGSVDWTIVFIIIIVYILVGEVSTTIIVACLLLLHQYMSEPTMSCNLRKSQFRAQPQTISRPQLLFKNSSEPERFGNSHEYELLRQNKDVNNATSRAAWGNFQRLQHRSGGEMPYLRESKDNDITEMVDDILYPKNSTVDDRMSKYTSHNERKSRKSLEYRSGMTRDKFERFFANELDTHAHRVWWENTEDVHSRKHVMF